MLVDDEDSIRTSLRRFFTHKGWDVVEARDGAEALAILVTAEGDTFSMVVCDLRMPGMGGVELHARLKVEAPHILDRLVVVSGDVVSPAAAAFVASSKCRLLEKPFELKALAVVAEELLAAQLSGVPSVQGETPGGSTA
jgi:DNA-binding NtrC family response regulator